MFSPPPSKKIFLHPCTCMYIHFVRVYGKLRLSDRQTQINVHNTNPKTSSLSKEKYAFSTSVYNTQYSRLSAPPMSYCGSSAN